MNHLRRHLLLQLARDTITAHLSGRPLPQEPLPADLRPEEPEYGGVFVTLRSHGRLRGCIGEFRAGRNLAEAVRRMAVSVLSDPRFARHPVTLQEVPDLSIEISILSTMERTGAPELLEPGTHGIYLRRGGRGGCFLPQVATEQGWDAHQLLSHCCTHKAGLPEDAWRDPQTEVYLFTAEVLDEEHAPSSPGDCG